MAKKTPVRNKSKLRPPAVPVATLRETIEHLAPFDRTPCSSGERDAAEWIAQRLRDADCRSVELEDEPSWGIFAATSAGLGFVGLLGGLLSLRGHRWLGTAISLAATVGIIDEAQNGPRVVRRSFRRQQKTVNVVARVGDRASKRRLVVLAHHDAPQTGVLFDQSLLIKAYERWPELVASRKSSPPQWWIALVAPVLAIVGLLTGKRSATAVGMAVGALGTASLVDIMRSPTVPGANDNLSGVAVLTALAQMLRDQPLDDLEVWLVSCGAEETLQDGIRAFVTRHRAELDDGETWVLNCDTVGSPHLVMLEGEGPFWMEDYTDPKFRDLVEQCATGEKIDLERGLRARSSTDSIIPSRAGWPTATLVSLTDWRGLANYHLMSDTPDKIDYSTVADATQLAYATALGLSAKPS